MNFRRCRRVEINSFRLFNVANSGLMIMKYFSAVLTYVLLCHCQMNGMMVQRVHIKVALSRRQPNMGDTQGHHRRPGLGSRGKELFHIYTIKCN